MPDPFTRTPARRAASSVARGRAAQLPGGPILAPRLASPSRALRICATALLAALGLALAESPSRADEVPAVSPAPAPPPPPEMPPPVPPHASAAEPHRRRLPPPPQLTFLGGPRCTSKQLCWNPQFNRMDAPEMILTGVAGAVALTTNIMHPLGTGWSGGILLDDDVRSALRLHSVSAEYQVRSASDLGLAIMVSYPVLVDSLLVAYWYRGAADVGLQMGLIDLEAFTLTAAIQGTTNVFAGRARPYSSECGSSTLPGDTTDCQDATRYRSFFSGHAAVSFTSAALICAHHEALRLFDTAADHYTCAAGFVAAAAIGTMRIMGDEHYFSDVLLGAAVGTTVGLAVPLLHHYKAAPGSASASTVHVHVVPSLGGAQVVGDF